MTAEGREGGVPQAPKPDPRVGLCSTCRHARRVPTPQKIYWLCERAAREPQYERYPRLPVTHCAGHEPGEPLSGVRAEE